MTDEIRERARAWIDELRGPFEMVEPSIDALVDLLLSERSAALGAAGEVADRVARANSKLSRDMEDHDLLAGMERHRGVATAVEEVGRQIRSLSPEGWVGVPQDGMHVPVGWSAVRTEDLAVLKEAAHEALAHFYAPLEELQQYRDRADEIRAALARMP